MPAFHELTADNLSDYLEQQGQFDGPFIVTPLAWGVSNAVFRVETFEGPFIVKQSRPQLRTKIDWFSDLERIYREQDVMELLDPLLPEATVPRVLFADREHYVLAMTHAPLSAQVWKGLLLAGKVDWWVAERAGEILGQIHQQTAKHPICAKSLADKTYFDQLRIDPFYRGVQKRVPDVAGAIQPLIDQLLSITQALCHGDYSPKNILVHGSRFTLVDYETGHYGDPTFDLGFFLSHLLLKAIKRHPDDAGLVDLTRIFWASYRGTVTFCPFPELEERGIAHCGACLLARIDGTSPVDYLTEEREREAARKLGRGLLLEKPKNWKEVIELYWKCLS